MVKKLNIFDKYNSQLLYAHAASYTLQIFHFIICHNLCRALATKVHAYFGRGCP